ncbi:MAG: DNA adenine methylase [Planctomycetota bacterium]|nr:DNA adenine methylase [Planctomycetota bacterium]MDA1112759.1 DNA adenine methylase [Planctomycetota bacterium]
MIKYLGSKRLLLPFILEACKDLVPSGKVLDLFSGTSRVGQALKSAGYQVTANDSNQYAEVVARCYVEANAEEHLDFVQQALFVLEQAPSVDGWFTETYCRESRFFQPENGMRIEGMRQALEAMDLQPVQKAILLVALMEAADRVDSTTGVQMAFLKQWAKRASNALDLRTPELLPQSQGGASEVWCLDAIDAAKKFQGDLVYLDPPYNQHSYLGNYHIWETLVRWDQPEVYGIARKRVDCRERRSPFNSKPGFKSAFSGVLDALHGHPMVVSFSDEGYISRAQMERLLEEHGTVEVRAKEHPRYVGAKIGIHNLQGAKVGKVSHLRNKEFLFLVSP